MGLRAPRLSAGVGEEEKRGPVHQLRRGPIAGGPVRGGLPVSVAGDVASDADCDNQKNRGEETTVRGAVGCGVREHQLATQGRRSTEYLLGESGSGVCLGGSKAAPGVSFP